MPTIILNKVKFKIFFIIFILISGNIGAQNFIPASCYIHKSQLKDFIKAEMVYPEKALQEKTEGTVELSFIINPDGSIQQLKIIEPVSPEINKEAIRIFKKIIWIPAENFGKPVASRHIFSIKFNIKKYKKNCKIRGYTNINYPYQPVDTTNKIYFIRDIDSSPIPVFESKNYSLDRFINENIIYPEAAFKQNISGIVTVCFIVETHGMISNIVAEEPLAGGCSQEAIRIIKLLKWKPGIKDKKAVRVKMSLDITFKLTQSSEHQMVPNNQNKSM